MPVFGHGQPVRGDFVMKDVACPACGHARADVVCRCVLNDRRCSACGLWWRVERHGERLVSIRGRH